ncbi:MAG: serine hydrolase, partial [Desulfurococcaceae archaeon]
YKGSVRVRVKRSGDLLVVEDLYARRAPLTLVPSRIEEDYAEFYVATLYTKIPVEFYIRDNRVVMIYERYLLVKER